MNGSAKQIKWAEDIKAEKLEQFEALKTKAQNKGMIIGVKAVDYVLSQPNASFWIDYRLTSAYRMMDALLSTGLEIYGGSYSHRAVLDPRAGTVTITWDEIVGDGKGGHIEKQSKIINL